MLCKSIVLLLSAPKNKEGYGVVNDDNDDGKYDDKDNDQAVGTILPTALSTQSWEFLTLAVASNASNKGLAPALKGMSSQTKPEQLFPPAPAANSTKMV